MTYLTFNLIFLIPVLLVLLVLQWKHLTRVHIAALLTLMAIALVYTTPWDNMLVRENIWSHAPEAVIGTIGYVPLEEYMFIVVQPLIVGLWLLVSTKPPQHVRQQPLAPRIIGVLLALSLVPLGLILNGIEQWRYLGLIIAWVGPAFALQFAVGGGVLWQQRRRVAIGALIPAVYLSIADRIAIGLSIWTITPATSSGMMIGGLPIEEALFFVVTSLLVVHGIVLFQWVHEVFNWQIRLPMPEPQTFDQDAIRMLQTHFFIPVMVLFGGLALAFALGLNIPFEMQLIPLVASAALLGLPHGALDHLAPSRVTGKRLGIKVMVFFLVGYLLMVGLFLGLWWVVPAVGFVIFILMTLLHWGQGDLHALLAFGTGRDASRPSRLLTLVARGSLPMLVPLVAFPADYELAAVTIVEVFGGTAEQLAWAFSANLRSGVVILLGGLLSLHISLLYLDLPKKAFWYAAAETLTLVAFFAFVPAFFAVGLYFCLWHASRHIARLMLLDPESERAFAAGKVGLPLIRFGKQALPMTLGALLLLSGLYIALPQTNLLDSLGLYLALIAALTLPHMIVVTWMDWQEGVWSAAPDANTEGEVVAKIVRQAG